MSDVSSTPPGLGLHTAPPRSSDDGICTNCGAQWNEPALDGCPDSGHAAPRSQPPLEETHYEGLAEERAATERPWRDRIADEINFVAAQHPGVEADASDFNLGVYNGFRHAARIARGIAERVAHEKGTSSE